MATRLLLGEDLDDRHAAWPPAAICM